MNRRGFLGAMLAACAGPAIVRAASLMPVRVIEQVDRLTLAHIAELKRQMGEDSLNPLFSGKVGLYSGPLFLGGTQWTPVERALLAARRESAYVLLVHPTHFVELNRIGFIK